MHGPKAIWQQGQKWTTSLKLKAHHHSFQVSFLATDMRHLEALVLLSTAVTSVLGAESPRPQGVGPECKQPPKPPPEQHLDAIEHF